MIAEITQSIFHIVLAGVMCLAANMLWYSRKLIRRQIEETELRIQKLKQE
ncbi:hypothetical protein P2G70_12685 [Mannheimia haemolytica]|nr:hypothetical protein [Mannheimia haemolytica]